jgi:cytochrome c-type biogenesis protein CcmH
MSTEGNIRQRETPPIADGSNSETATTERVRSLTEQLRCLVCQNQTIADSNAGLAIDLRQQVVQQVKAGKTDGEIKQYMVERYGDFVLYNPPFSANNSVLWIGPFILLALGILLVWRSVLRRPQGSSPPVPTSTDQRLRLQALEARYQESSQSLHTPGGRPSDKHKKQTEE